MIPKFLELIQSPLPSDDYVVQKNEIHLWQFSFSNSAVIPASVVISSPAGIQSLLLDPLDPRLHMGNKPYHKLLNDEENRRANRLKNAAARTRFIFSRIALKELLSRYLHRPLSSLHFVYNPAGKPSIVDTDLTFNVSHAEDRVLIAIARQLSLGIDIEYQKKIPYFEPLIQRCLTLTEQKELQRLPPALREKRFYQLWTGKEAIVKALGKSLWSYFKAIEISFENPDVPKILQLPVDSQDDSSWNLRQISMDQPYSACLAWKGSSHIKILVFG